MQTQFLETELQWLDAVITRSTEIHVKHLNHHHPFSMEEVYALGPPPLDDDCAYSNFLTTHGFNRLERLALILALAPVLRPQMLDIFMAKNPNFDRVCTEFGGTIEIPHRGVIPTIETLMFLHTGRDQHIRLEVARLFQNDHPFTEKALMRLDFGSNKPWNACKLIPDEEVAHLALFGEVPLPGYSPTFPARYLKTEMNWEDLVLPTITLDQLKEIENWLRFESVLRQDAFLRKRLKPGYRVLFYGPPGTGKTLAATLLGKSTKQPVFRVDLSQVVSKYIGETEKNLANLFDKAAHKNWILFFDEADALFGKRSQTESANDRYANQEVAYLLQRIENYPGLVILASNFKGNIDPAFVRRFQTIIHFPFPDFQQRITLWEKTLPPSYPFTEDIDLRQLAGQYELSGSHIANIIQTCCIESLANQSEHISKGTLSKALKKEFLKEERVYEPFH